jgi:DNA-binding HxlR family transcriptional regulator
LVDYQVIEIEHGQEKYNRTSILGKRWTLMILRYLSEKKVARFSEIKRTLTSISGTVLSERLLELENEELVTKKVYSEIPPKVEYSLTDRAKELESIMNALDRWYVRWNIEGKKNGKNNCI